MQDRCKRSGVFDEQFDKTCTHTCVYQSLQNYYMYRRFERHVVNSADNHRYNSTTRSLPEDLVIGLICLHSCCIFDFVISKERDARRVAGVVDQSPPFLPNPMPQALQISSRSESATLQDIDLTDSLCAAVLSVLSLLLTAESIPSLRRRT